MLNKKIAEVYISRWWDLCLNRTTANMRICNLLIFGKEDSKEGNRHPHMEFKPFSRDLSGQIKVSFSHAPLKTIPSYKTWIYISSWTCLVCETGAQTDNLIFLNCLKDLTRSLTFPCHISWSECNCVSTNMIWDKWQFIFIVLKI